MDEWSPPEPDAVPEDLIPFVKPELAPDERLLWAATVRPRPAFNGQPHRLDPRPSTTITTRRGQP